MDKIDLNDTYKIIYKKILEGYDSLLISSALLMPDYIRYDFLDDLENNMKDKELRTKYKI